MDLLNAYLGIFEKGGTASFKKKKGGILDIFATPLYTAMSSARGVTFNFLFSFSFSFLHILASAGGSPRTDPERSGMQYRRTYKRFKLGLLKRAVEGRQKIVSGRNRNLATGWPWNPGHRNPSIHALRPIRQSFINFSARFIWFHGSH